MQTQLINFMIPKSLLKKIDQVVKKEQYNRSELLRQAIRKFLKDQDQEDQDFALIEKTAQKINLDEPKAIKLVEEERGAIPLNQ